MIKCLVFINKLKLKSGIWVKKYVSVNDVNIINDLAINRPFNY